MDTYQIIQKLRDIQVVEHGTFTLKSGLTTDTYIDLRKLYSYPELMNMVGDFLRAKISSEGYYLVGVPTGGVLFAAALALKHNIPMLTIRETSKTHGKKQIVEGDRSLYEKKVILIEDVISTGESVLKCARQLESEGFKVVQILCVVDRNLGGIAMLNEKRYPTQALIKIHELLPKKSNHHISKLLTDIMDKKESNIVVSLDLSSALDILDMTQKIGPYVCGIKLHFDIIDFSEKNENSFMIEMRNLKYKYAFIIIDDRKYADIPSISRRQFLKYAKEDCVDLITMHAISGEALVKAFQDQFDVGVLLVHSMSCAGNLIDSNYEHQVEEMGERYSNVVGFISQKKVKQEGFLTFTPGISIEKEKETDGMGQQYRDPSEVDTNVYIIGRAITEAKDPVSETKKYRKYCWNCQHY